MKFQYSLAIVALLLLAAVAVWLVGRHNAPLSVSISPEELAHLNNAEEYEYQSESGERVVVEYAGELARINGGQYDQVTLRQVVAASGVKYEGEQGLVLWTKGDEVRIETPQELIFVGSEVMVDVVEEEVPNTPVSEEETATTTSADTSSFVGFEWVWERAVVDGATIAPEKAGVYSVTFGQDGRLSGKTDCNGFGGSYTVEADGSITFSEFMATLMFCEGSQESVFSGLFVGPVTVTSVDEGALVLKNTNGSTITLTKKE